MRGTVAKLLRQAAHGTATMYMDGADITKRYDTGQTCSEGKPIYRTYTVSTTALSPWSKRHMYKQLKRHYKSLCPKGQQEYITQLKEELCNG